MITSLFATAFFAIAAVEEAQVRSAAILDVPSGPYLQLEIGPLPGGKAPRVVSTVFGEAAISFEWSLVPNDTAGSARWADVLVPCGAKTCWASDSVWDESRRSAVPVVGRVENPREMVCPMVKCAAIDSVSAFQAAVGRIRSSRHTFVMSQSPIATLVAVSPWTATTGTELAPEVAVQRAGNLGNWIQVPSVRFAIDSGVRWTSAIAPRNLWWTIPLGNVEYQYQIRNDPWTADTNRTGGAFVVDSILKLGPRLHLAGFLDRTCFSPAVDSQVAKRTSWFIAAGAVLSDSVRSAFLRDGYCGQVRRGAWPFQDGRVELVAGKWVLLQELIDAAYPSASIGILPPSGGDAPVLRRQGSTASLELPARSLVRIVDIRGAELLPSTPLEAGIHPLPVNAGSATLFVQVRTGLSTVTLPLEPLR